MEVLCLMEGVEGGSAGHVTHSTLYLDQLLINASHLWPPGVPAYKLLRLQMEQSTSTEMFRLRSLDYCPKVFPISKGRLIRSECSPIEAKAYSPQKLTAPLP